MMLWSRPATDCGQITAQGSHGVYTIRWVGALGYTLTGRDTDDLPMMQLPPYGRIFEHIDDAKQFAEQLERGAMVGEVSGC